MRLVTRKETFKTEEYWTDAGKADWYPGWCHWDEGKFVVGLKMCLGEGHWTKMML